MRENIKVAVNQLSEHSVEALVEKPFPKDVTSRIVKEVVRLIYHEGILQRTGYFCLSCFEDGAYMYICVSNKSAEHTT